MQTQHFPIRLDSVHQRGFSHKHASPKKADGDTVPLLRETMTLIPVSTKGTEKSTTSDLSSLIVSEPMAMSARLYTTYRERESAWDTNLIMGHSCGGFRTTKPIFYSSQRFMSRWDGDISAPWPFVLPQICLHGKRPRIQSGTKTEHVSLLHLFSI